VCYFRVGYLCPCVTSGFGRMEPVYTSEIGEWSPFIPSGMGECAPFLPLGMGRMCTVLASHIGEIGGVGRVPSSFVRLRFVSRMLLFLPVLAQNVGFRRVGMGVANSAERREKV